MYRLYTIVNLSHVHDPPPQPPRARSFPNTRLKSFNHHSNHSLMFLNIGLMVSIHFQIVDHQELLGTVLRGRRVRQEVERGGGADPMCCVLCVVCCVLCAVCCVLCTVYCVLCTVYCVLCTVYCSVHNCSLSQSTVN